MTDERLIFLTRLFGELILLQVTAWISRIEYTRLIYEICDSVTFSFRFSKL